MGVQQCFMFCTISALLAMSMILGPVEMVVGYIFRISYVVCVNIFAVLAIFNQCWTLSEEPEALLHYLDCNNHALRVYWANIQRV